MLRSTHVAAVLLASISLLATGCSSSSAAGTGGNSGGNATIQLSGSLAFPNTTTGQTSTAQAITVTNTGTAAATISAYTLSGNTTDFTQTASTCGATLAAGSACNITFTFTPVAAGSFTLTLTLTDSAGTQSTTLTGTGIATTYPSAKLTPASLTFPTTSANTTAAAQTLTLTNVGGVALTLSSIGPGGANPTAFAQTSTCPAIIAAGTSCTISITFTPPAAATTYTATLIVTDNSGGVAGSTQVATLSGTSAAPANTPLAVLSPTFVTFPSTILNTAATAQTVTLSNPGTATLTGIAVSITGTNAAAFSDTTTCTATLAAGSSCTISIGFTPTATGTLFGFLNVADNATGSPQGLALTGTGITSTSATRQFYVFPESDNSATPLYALVNGAKKTIDMTMYALQDATFTADLVAACQRGVTVRVILDQNNEKSNDTPDFNLINAQAGCTAVWANKAFQVTHEKSFIIDGTTVAIMSLNLQQQYYSTTRDYALVETDANDIAAIQATFNMDFAAGTTAGGTVGTSDFSYAPQPGTDLVWSPTTATTNMLAIINNATKTLYIENEEFSAPNIVSAVAAAATRGVKVILVGEYSSSYVTNYATVKAAGASVYYYSSSTGFYVHGKTVVADLGLATEAVYMGSINYSTASLTQNRELGIYITGNTSVSNPIASVIAATIVSDESQPGVTHY